MYGHTRTTENIPSKPLMAWDGKCGFCHYWVIKWKILTGDKVEYKPFQKAYQDFPDIDLSVFRKAIHFIDTDGKVYSGPAAVFQALHKYGSKWKWVMPLYRKVWFFRAPSNLFYSFVTRNRVWIYEFTIRLFGKNPARPKHYWAIYAGVLLVSAVVVCVT